MNYNKLVESADQRLFIIGEAGVNHNGSLNTAKQLVDVAIAAGCDAVKFQTWITEKVYSRELSIKPDYQIRSTGFDESAYDSIKKLELPFQDLAEIKQYCEKRDILFFSTPDEQDSAQYLCDLGVPLMKSASQDVTNLPFLRYLGGLGLPLIFSTGAATEDEIAAAVDVLREVGAQLIIMHCVSAYPAPIEQLNLRMIPALASKFRVPVGFSDHSVGPEAACAAVALGATFFEKHFTLDKAAPGPDHQASAPAEELAHYVSVLRDVHEGLGDGLKRVLPAEADTRLAFRRFLVAARPIVKGSRFSAEDFVFKKIASGIPPAEMDRIVGKPALADIKPDTPIRWDLVG